MFLGVTPTILRPSLVAAVAATTWSATDKTAGFVLSNGNRTATANNTSATGRSSTYRSSGKLFAEFTTGGTMNDTAIGLANSSAPLSFPNNPNSTAYEYIGYLYALGAITQDGTPIYSANAKVGVAVDFSARKAFFIVNGTWVSLTGSPSTGAGASVPSGDLALIAFVYGVDSLLLNAGQDAFSNSIPSGYTAWN